MSEVAGNTVHLRIDGEACDVEARITVAAALMQRRIDGVRRSVSGEPRGPLCGMGTCQECRATVDGVRHRRTCLITVADGMDIETTWCGA